MTRLLRLLPALVLPAFVLTGCGGDDGTDPASGLGDFDPDAVVAALDGLVRPIQATATTSAIINLETAFPSLTALGVALGTSPGQTGVAIPAELLGATLRYEPADGRWVVDESRTDAPADALRVLWYEIDGAGNIATPLREQGHVDLTEGAAVGIPEGLRSVAVETPAGGAGTVLSLAQAYHATAGATETTRYGGAGAYGDETADVDFTFSSERTISASGDEDEDLQVVLSGGGVRYEVAAAGAVDGSTGDIQDRITETVTVDGVTTVVQVELSSPGGGTIETEGFVRHRGSLVATISTTDAGQLAFTDADGHELSGADRSSLQTLYGTLQYGLYVVETLPLYFR